MSYESDPYSKIGRFWSPNPSHSEIFATRGVNQGMGGPVYAVDVNSSELLNRNDVKIFQGEVHLPDRLQQNARVVKDFSPTQPKGVGGFNIPKLFPEILIIL